MKKSHHFLIVNFTFAAWLMLSLTPNAFGISDAYKNNIYNPGILKATDSKVKVKIGQTAPGFTLPAVAGEKVSLEDYFGKKNVVLSLYRPPGRRSVPISGPATIFVKDLFDEHNTILLGITVDNIPTLFSWTNQMGKLWFPVLSDFYPHGQVAKRYGILRSDGVSERALFVIDKKGIIRYMDVHDINQRPSLEILIKELEKLE